MAETGAQLSGRRTRRWRVWPTVGDDDPFARHLDSVVKYVASRTMTEASWARTTVLSDDATQVRELKEKEAGTISVLGSPGLVQTLIEHDLVDECALAIHPVVLCSGRKLFRDAEPARRLELVGSVTTATGALMTTYRPVR